jgi:alanyl-tRNA synthetase
MARSSISGFFKLHGESGVAAGVRRIEAATGQGALDAVREHEKLLGQIGAKLGTNDAAALERLGKVLAHEKELEKKLRALEQKLAGGGGLHGSPAETVREVNGIKVVTRRADGIDPRALRELADRLRKKYPSAVVVLGSDLGEGKVALLVAVTADLTDRIKAGDIIKQVAPIIGGSGGGRPDLAQAGGRDAEQLDAALEKVVTLVS